MATVALEAAWLDTTGGFLFIAWEMTVGNWLGAPALTGVPTLTVNGGAGPVATAHGVAKKGTSHWIARYSLASAIAAGATVTVSASAGSCANGAITSSPSLSGAAVTNNATGASTPTTVYVDKDEEPGGVGTEASPFCSLNEARVYIASGVTVYATGGVVQTGTAHEWDGANGLTLDDIDGWVIRQWPGRARWVHSGACPILGFDGNTSAGYRVDGMDVEPEFIGYGVGDKVVARTQTHPRYGLTVYYNQPSFGMEEALGAAEGNQITACQTATSGVGLWAYDSSNDRLWVHSTQGDGNPASDAYDYFVLMRSASGGNVSNGISVLSSDDWLIEGGDILYWMERTTAYCVFGQTCRNSIIRNCRASGYGYHGLGFAANDCYFNTIEDCTIDTASTATDSAVVFYSSATNVQGCRGDRLTIHCSTILRHDATDVSLQPLRIGGAAAATNPGISPGLAAHSSSTVTTIDTNGVIYRHCNAYGWTDSLDNPHPCFAFTGDHDVPIDLTEPSLYPVLIEDSTFAGPAWGLCSGGGDTAFERCVFGGTMGTTTGVGGTSCFVRLLNAAALFRSCVLSGTGVSGTAGSALIRCQNQDPDTADRSHATVLGCSLYQKATDASLFAAFKYGSGAADRYGRWTVRNCILRMATDGSSTSRLFSGTAVGSAGGLAARISFSGNLYDVLIPDTLFGQPDANINTQAEWTASVDATGVYDVDLSAAFESDVTLKPTTTSIIKNYQTSNVAYRGIDTRNNRRHGAWQQFDPQPHRIRGGRRDDTTTRPILG